MEQKITVKKVNGKVFNEILQVPTPCAVILYGHGAELGDFEIYAKSLYETELSKKFGKKNVFISRITGKLGFFKYFRTFPFSKFQIKELHILCHSFGAGLAFSYRESIMKNDELRESELKKIKIGDKFTYEQVVDIEPNLLTDHFSGIDYLLVMPLLFYNFKPSNKDAFIKIWGCNSGVENWIYGYGETRDYYWRALNDKNTPKPSIAQKIADSFGVKTFGAKSGSNCYVFVNEKWISSQNYRDKYGKWPSTKYPHRLKPEHGDYYEFNPK